MNSRDGKAVAITFSAMRPIGVMLLFVTFGCTDESNSSGLSERSPHIDAVLSDILSTDSGHEIASRILRGPRVESRDGLMEYNTYHYDFGAVQSMEARITDVDTRVILQKLFEQVTSNVSENDHNEKWLVLADFVSRSVRHPPLTQPMYRDKTMVTHPLVLLLLHEGRCGHVARVIVDIALANGYEARLVQLAAHLVAEVRWNGSWHFIDANADFPLERVRNLFAELPSLEKLSRNPYRIDSLPARGWLWSERNYRTTTGAKLPYTTWYPGRLLTSSIYFGRQILQNQYSGDPNAPRKGLIYYYKEGTTDDWQRDKYYGWSNLDPVEQPIHPVPVEFHPAPVSVVTPAIVYKRGTVVEIPVRFLPVRRIAVSGKAVFCVQFDQAEVTYEVRVSSQSRGWNYDFRNYRFMPEFGRGDIATFDRATEYDSGMLGVDLRLEDVEGEVFIEVIPTVRSLQERECFTWPSQEVSVQVFPRHYKRWEH